MHSNSIQFNLQTWTNLKIIFLIHLDFYENDQHQSKNDEFVYLQSLFRLQIKSNLLLMLIKTNLLVAIKS